MLAGARDHLGFWSDGCLPRPSRLPRRCARRGGRGARGARRAWKRVVNDAEGSLPPFQNTNMMFPEHSVRPNGPGVFRVSSCPSADEIRIGIAPQQPEASPRVGQIAMNWQYVTRI